jgi:hypothetical protein
MAAAAVVTAAALSGRPGGFGGAAVRVLVAAAQAVQQPWLLLALLGLLGRTRLWLHLLVQTACLLPVLLATLYHHHHAAARQRQGAWSLPLWSGLGSELSAQLLVSFLLVSLLVHWREASSRLAFVAQAGTR